MAERLPAQGSQGDAARSGPGSSFDRVLGAAAHLGLSVRTTRTNEAFISCPLHDDKSPSLHVTWKPSAQGGFVLLWCHPCNLGAADLAEPLGLTQAELYDEPMPARLKSFTRVGKSPDQRRAAKRRSHLGRLPAFIVVSEPAAEPDHAWVEIERYPYVDLKGRLVQEVIRSECTAEGARHKSFRQVFVTAAGGRAKTKPRSGFEPVLYRAPQVQAAVAQKRTVWLLEGEKDVHAAEALGLVATTNTQGGESFPDSLVDALAGADVVAVLDRDAVGWARGVDLHAKLTSVDTKVRLTVARVDEPKADFSDHVDAGFTVNELIEVSVDEVVTWNALRAVKTANKMLDRAVLEAEAQLQAAEGTEGSVAEQHRKYAKRWAAEVEVRYETLSVRGDKVHGLGFHAGTPWAGVAMQLADETVAKAGDLARRCLLTVGVPVPPALRKAAQSQPTGEEPIEIPVGDDTPTEEQSFGAAGVGATSTVFRIAGGQIVQWEPNRRKDNEDEDGRYKVLLSTVVRITAREFLEVDTDEDDDDIELMGRESSAGRRIVSTPRKLAAMRVEYPDQVTGELMEIRIQADAWRDHTWIESLPGPVDYDHKRAGLDNLQRAILAVSNNVVDTVIHRTTGWRHDDEGQWQFIHRRGAIGAGGHTNQETSFEGSIDRFDLPDPTQVPERIREAFFDHSLTMLDRLPERVMAPLLGAVFRSALGHNPWVMTLVGPPGSYKTSIASKAMHHWGERWSQTKAASSASGNGDTFNVMRYKLHHAKDTLTWLDDFAPTKSWLEAQKHLEEIARLVHNQEARGRLDRLGMGVNPGTPPRASALCTSEVMPRPGSGAERMLVLPLAKRDIQTELLFPLEEGPSRHGRALVMASFIQWLAADLTERRSHYKQLGEAYAEALVSGHGETVRQGAALASTWTGWVAMSDFLLDVGAINETERTKLLGRVDGALCEAGKAAVDPDLPRETGARVRELLAYALGQGIAYVDDVRTGDCPPWPLASRLGWRKTTTETDQLGHATKQRNERGSVRLGYVLHDPGARDRGRVLMCESTQIEAVLKAAGATQTEQLQIDRNTAMRALYDEGALVADESEGKLRFTNKCKIFCEERSTRMVVLQLDRIIGTDLGDTTEDPNPGPGGGGGPADPPTSPDSSVATPKIDVDQQEIPNPHDMDGPQQPTVTSTPSLEEADHMDATDWKPRPWTDLDGIVGWGEVNPVNDVSECPICGQPSGMKLAGIYIHPLCWERSNQEDRERGNQTVEEPQQHASVVPIPAPAPAATKTQTTTASQTAGPKTGSGPVAKRPATFRALAAVVDVDGIWCSNGEHFPLEQRPTHLGEFFELAHRLNLGMMSSKFLTESAQIWLGNDLARELGIDIEAIKTDRHTDDVIRKVTAESDLVTGAIEAGYTLGGDGASMRPWTRIWRGKEKSVFICLIVALPEDPRAYALGAGEPDHATLARRIGLFAHAVGFPYYMGSGTTGTDLMKHLRYKDKDRFFSYREPVPPATMNVEPEMEWSRPPTEEELDHKFAHCYDRSGSYLAGVSGLELGYGQATHYPEGCEFVPRAPAYWRIEIPEMGDWRMPNPLDPRSKIAGQMRWVTTPSLEFAIEQGYAPEILEAYVWAEHARILDPWYERLRDARTSLDVDDQDHQAARNQVKGVYAAAVGMTGSKRFRAGKEGYSPDWRHHIIAKARTNVLRRVAQIGEASGRWPVAIVTDSVIYTSDEADPLEAWPGTQKQLGRQLGRYKLEGSGTLEDQLPFLNGKGYAGKHLLVTPDEWGE